MYLTIFLAYVVGFCLFLGIEYFLIKRKYAKGNLYCRNRLENLLTLAVIFSLVWPVMLVVVAVLAPITLLKTLFQTIVNALKSRIEKAD